MRAWRKSGTIEIGLDQHGTVHTLLVVSVLMRKGVSSIDERLDQRSRYCAREEIPALFTDKCGNIVEIKS